MGHHANLGLARLGVSTPERQEVTTLPVLPPALPPVLEQAAPVDVEMATEEPEEDDVLGDVQVLFGKKEKDLTKGERAELEGRRKQWAVQKEVDAQVERDAQLQAQLQADGEAKAAHSAKKQEAKELEATRGAFEDIP